MLQRQVSQQNCFKAAPLFPKPYHADSRPRSPSGSFGSPEAKISRKCSNKTTARRCDKIVICHERPVTRCESSNRLQAVDDPVEHALHLHEVFQQAENPFFRLQGQAPTFSLHLYGPSAEIKACTLEST